MSTVVMVAAAEIILISQDKFIIVLSTVALELKPPLAVAVVVVQVELVLVAKEAAEELAAVELPVQASALALEIMDKDLPPIAVVMGEIVMAIAVLEPPFAMA